MAEAILTGEAGAIPLPATERRVKRHRRREKFLEEHLSDCASALATLLTTIENNGAHDEEFLEDADAIRVSAEAALDDTW